jgi:dTDP-L-rhamnose 4-epimerase
MKAAIDLLPFTHPRILVTGGAGFIGSHLVRYLLDVGYRVRVLDALTAQIHGQGARPPAFFERAGVEFRQGSVTSRADCESALEDVDCLVHLAAETGVGQSMYEVARYTEVNVLGTAMLLDVIANLSASKPKRVVLASSRAIYGEGAYHCRACSPKTRVYPGARPAEQLVARRWEPECEQCGGPLVSLPTLESDPPRPASVYACTKLAQEDLVKVSCASMGIDSVALRFQNVYGEGQSLKNPYTGLLSIFSNRARQGFELPIFEDGLETRDFVHVSDVVEAISRCIQSVNPLGVSVNVGSGVGTTVVAAASQLARSLGVSPTLTTTGQFRIGDIRHNVADIGRLKDLLDFTPRVTFEHGLERFCSWVQHEPPSVDRLAEANAEMQARGLMGSARSSSGEPSK